MLSITMDFMLMNLAPASLEMQKETIGLFHGPRSKTVSFE